MRKGILLAEYFRVREIYEVLDRWCPVCEASHKLKPRFKEKRCDADFHMTACHPTVQKRCQKTMGLSGNLTEYLDDTLIEIREALTEKFGLYGFTLDELFEEYLKGRREEYV